MFVSEWNRGWSWPGCTTMPRRPRPAWLPATSRRVGGVRPTGLAELFRGVWSTGPAGVAVEFEIQRDDRVLTLSVPSVDRRDFWKRPHLH